MCAPGREVGFVRMSWDLGSLTFKCVLEGPFTLVHFTHKNVEGLAYLVNSGGWWPSAHSFGEDSGLPTGHLPHSLWLPRWCSHRAVTFSLVFTGCEDHLGLQLCSLYYFSAFQTSMERSRAFNMLLKCFQVGAGFLSLLFDRECRLRGNPFPGRFPACDKDGEWRQQIQRYLELVYQLGDLRELLPLSVTKFVW